MAGIMSLKEHEEYIKKKKNNLVPTQNRFSGIVSSNKYEFTPTAKYQLEVQKSREKEAKNKLNDYMKKNNITFNGNNSDINVDTRVTENFSSKAKSDAWNEAISPSAQLKNKFKENIGKGPVMAAPKMEQIIKEAQKNAPKYEEFYRSDAYRNYTDELYKTPLYQYYADVESVKNQDDFSFSEKAFNSFLGGLRSSLHMDQQYRMKDPNGKFVYVDLPNYQQIKTEKIMEKSGTLGKIYQQATQSIGQMVPSMVAAGVTAGVGLGPSVGSLSVMGINAYSSSKNQALLDGYTEEQSEKYGIMNAGVELVTEKMFDGLGGKFGEGWLDKLVTEKITKNVSNQVTKTLIEAGIDSLGEGVEELVSDIAQPVLKQLALGSKDDYATLLKDEDLATDFFAGVLSSAIMSSPQTIRNLNTSHKLNVLNNQNNKNNNADVKLPINNNMNNIQDFNNNLDKYSNHEIENFKNGKVKIVQNMDDINNFVESSQKVPSNAKLYFGKIGTSVANKIFKALGINVENYNISLQTNAVRHIIKNHGNTVKENNRGQVAVTAEDFKLIPKIVSEFDNIQEVGTTENNNKTITFQKQIGDTYYLVNYVSDKNHNLEVKTMWKIKANKKNSVNAIDAVMPRSETSETNNDTSSFSTNNNSTTNQQSQIVPLPINSNMQQNQNDTQLSKNSLQAKEIFGITNDFKKAGYIIRNGELLDFSDGNIQNEHSDINRIVDMESFLKEGNIRISDKSNEAIVEIGNVPSNEQLYKIMDFAESIYNKPLTVEMHKGNNDLFLQYDDINSIKVKNDIKNYYEKNIVPTNAQVKYNSKENNIPKSLKEQQNEKINNWIKDGLIDDINDPNINKWIKGYPSIFPDGKILSKENINIPTSKDINKINMPPVENNQKTNNRISNPNEISQLTKEDANTTPKLPVRNRNQSNDGESRFYENIRDKTNMLTDEQKGKILDSDEVKYYDKVTNKESLNKALEKLEKNGLNESLKWFNKDSKKADSVDVAEGYILLKQYADNNDYDSMVEVAKKMRDIGTKAGQTVQAFNIMERLTPEGMVKYAQSELQEAYDNMIKNKSQDWIDKHRKDFDLKPDEVKFIMDNMKEVSTMEDGYDKKVKLAEIQKIMTDKLPPEKGAGIKSWMRISMLFNPKTQVRNVAGNAIIMPVNAFSDLFASYADKIIAKKTGVRTTGKTNLKALIKGGKEGFRQSTNDARKGINTRNMQGNRFEITEIKSFDDNTLVGKSLNRLDGMLNYVMDAGDRIFSQAALENSLQNQLVLNNTTKITSEMLDIAESESLQRTWNDNNNYTKFVLDVRRMMNKIHLPGVDSYGLGDVLIPFAKTPANLTKAIVDYSPVGLINTLVEGNNLRKSLSNGQFTASMQHKFVQDLGKTLAGTSLYVLGYALAKSGTISGKSDDDKDVSNFLKNTLGVSSYSIKIGNKSFTYDWAQPIAAPFSIMANVVNSKNNKGQALTEAIVSSLDTAGSILLEQSFVQSINDVLSDNDGVVSGLINEMLELPARAVPTFSKQIADMVDGTQRTSFEYGKPLKSAVNSFKAKIPFVSKTLAPTVDTMGREVKKYGGKNNLFNVFLNPANVNTENVSDSAKEIYRLYKQTGNTNIMPRVAPYYVNKKGEKITLNSEQRAKYQKTSGKIIEDGIKGLLKSKEYKNMSDDRKAEVINDIVNYSYNIAQKEVLDTELSQTYQKAYEYSKIGDIQDYYLFKNSIDNDNKKESISNFLIESSLNDKQLAYLYGNYYSSEEKLDTLISLNIPIKEFIKLDSADIQGEYNSKTGQTISGSKKNAYIRYVNTLKLTIPQKATLIKMNYKSYDKYDTQIVNYVKDNISTTIDRKLALKQIGFDDFDKDIVSYIISNYSTEKERQDELKKLGFTIRNGKVYY